MLLVDHEWVQPVSQSPSHGDIDDRAEEKEQHELGKATLHSDNTISHPLARGSSGGILRASIAQPSSSRAEPGAKGFSCHKTGLLKVELVVQIGQAVNSIDGTGR